jgi:uncharacterized protein with von Willebrand factor type A (vWA) domain
MNKDKQVCVNLGLAPCTTNSVSIFDCLTSDEKEVDCDDLATTLESQNIGDTLILEIITRPPKEAIVVLLDTSSSMNSDFFNEAVSRLDAVKIFFSSFSDRTMAYDLHHVISLVLFSSEVRTI